MSTKKFKLGDRIQRKDLRSKNGIIVQVDKERQRYTIELAKGTPSWKGWTLLCSYDTFTPKAGRSYYYITWDEAKAYVPAKPKSEVDKLLSRGKGLYLKLFNKHEDGTYHSWKQDRKYTKGYVIGEKYTANTRLPVKVCVNGYHVIRKGNVADFLKEGQYGDTLCVVHVEGKTDRDCDSEKTKAAFRSMTILKELTAGERDAIIKLDNKRNKMANLYSKISG